MGSAFMPLIFMLKSKVHKFVYLENTVRETMQTFDEEITCMLASIDGEDHEEDTKPQDAEPIETFHVNPVPGGIVILTDEAYKQAVANNQPQITQAPLLPLIVVIVCSLFLITSIVFIPNTP